MAKKIPLTAYLTVLGCHEIDKCFDEEKIKEHEAKEIQLSQDLDSKMYMYAKPSEDPSWKSFFYNSSTSSGKETIDGLLSEERYSVSAAIAVPVGERFVVVTFGYGKSLVNWKFIEHDFGKKVIINSIDLDNFISIKSQYYDRHPKYFESQSSRKSNISEFELDFELLMLQKMTGEITDELRKKANLEEEDIDLRLTGSDSLSFNSYRDLSSIIKVVEWLVSQYEKPIEDEFFEAIDTLVPVKKSKITEVLNLQLVEGLKDRENDSFHLIIPTLLDYSEYSLFQTYISYDGGEYTLPPTDAPNIFDYRDMLSEVEGLDDITLNAIKTKHWVVCLSNDGRTERNKSFTLYKCLCGEVEIEDEKYALINGSWFKISKQFFERMVDTLNDFLYFESRLDRFQPDVDIDARGYFSEGEYNQRQADEIDGAILFDKEKIIFRGRGSIEPCDLKVGENFYHVKRHSSSSTLSHLFFQGSVSAAALIEDKDIYREGFLSKLPVEQKEEVNTLIENKGFNIVFTILMKESSYHYQDRGILNLPSFSIVSLYKTFKELTRMGVKLRIEIIFHPE